MTTTLERTGAYESLYRQEAGRRGGEPDWLASIRRDAMSRFEALDFPSTRQEEWKRTNLAPLARERFGTAPADASLAGVALPLDELNAARLVFVNGRFRPEFSDPAPAGVRFASLAEALAEGDRDLERRLARYAEYRDRSLVALNTALFADGAWIRVSEGATAERPIHVVHVTRSGSGPGLSSPRTLVVAEPGSRLQLIESYLGLGDGARWTNAVTEIVCGENSTVDRVKFQTETGNGVHIAAEQAHLSGNAVFRTLSLAMGGRLTRNETNAVLAGAGADCVLDGLYLAGGTEHVDNRTSIDHAAAHTSSRELYKGILAGRATAAFDGGIMVRPNAQKIAASQQNRNLLLSDDAVIHTKPELRIWADDVKCTHGATIGQLDSDALFYLRARGFHPWAARRILTRAFAADVLDKPKIPGLAGACDPEIGNWLRAHVGGEDA